MKRIVQKLAFITLLLPTLVFAASTTVPDQSVQLEKYYASACANYTGTWHGFFTDPTDLFGNGGPWPVTLSFINKGDKVAGWVSSKKAPGYVSGTMEGMIWANCSKGQLSNIFMGKPKQCGVYSQSGLLVSKDVMILKINYQNSMTGAPFYLFLKRVNNKFQGKLPKTMSIAAPETCH